MRLALSVFSMLFLVGCSDSSPLPAIPPGSWTVAPMTPVAVIPPFQCPAGNYPETLYNRTAEPRMLVLLDHKDVSLMKVPVPAYSGVNLCVPDATTKWEWRVRV